jgi:hypothetical protein
MRGSRTQSALALRLLRHRSKGGDASLASEPDVGTVGRGAARGSPFVIQVACVMVDREKVLAVLRRRFPGATDMDVAAAANAIVGLADEWREVETADLHELIERLRHGHEFRLFERPRAEP